jgi:uncharacterized protein (TIGR00730 family)
MKICVYCASSSSIDHSFFKATEEMTLDLLSKGVEFVFGGGATGLMGHLADTVLAHGGKIKGIMPKFMNEVEWGHKLVSDFEYVDTMHERKAKFLENVDGLVALPGGSGTLEELLEAITLKRLGLLPKPIVILNTNKYYDPLRSMLEKCVEEKFMNEKHLDMWSFVDKPGDVYKAILDQNINHDYVFDFARN